MSKIISLFSGAGGIDIGFKKAGFKTVLATDNWKIACETLKANKISHNITHNDIRKIKFSKYKNKIDCVVGGPPCPPYSKSRFYIKTKKRALEDDDSFTLEYFVKCIKDVNPKVFFFENVHGFIYKPHQDALKFLESKAKNLGYNLSFKVINCADYGVPQMRQRFICIGVKKKFGKFIFPKPTHSKFNTVLKKWVDCKEAIGDLDKKLSEDKERQAGSKHKDLLKLIPPGQNYLFFTKERGHPKPKFKWRSRYWSFYLNYHLKNHHGLFKQVSQIIWDLFIGVIVSYE